MKFVQFSIFSIINLNILFEIYGQDVSNACITSNNESGNCVNVQNCTSIWNEQLRRPYDRSYRSYVQQSNAICKSIIQNRDSNVRLVCCPNNEETTQPQFETATISTPPPLVTTISPPTSTIRPAPIISGQYNLLTPGTGCGFSNATHNKVVGGYPADMGAYPWMAVLKYFNTKKFTEEFRCGGSLITKRHVLTAAHCLTIYTTQVSAQLIAVRLGEYNYTTDLETEHIDVSIQREIAHEDYIYTTSDNDIAILLLISEIEFTSLIYPICIPFEGIYRTTNLEGYNPFVAGWGRTHVNGKGSDTLMEAQIEVLNLQECNVKFNEILNKTQTFTERMMCAGYMEGKIDSCFGDSGGPLMMPDTINGSIYYYEIGIVSFGYGCALEGLPGIYTRVHAFLDWINGKIGN